jgi:putative transposase
MAVARSCRAVGLSRTAWYRERTDRLERDGTVIEALHAIVEEHNRWGFWKCYRRLRLDGHGWNHKRVYRVYRELGLNLRRKTKKRVPTRDPQPMEAPGIPNEIWSLDFMHDALYVGRRFRTLNILDEGVREVLDIEIDTSLPGERVVQVLERLRSWRSLPKAIRCDNGPELLSEVFVRWCEENGIEIRYIQPGKPNQNAFIERFNRTYREEVLDAYLFESLEEVQEITYEWMEGYNERRPHDALGGLPPVVYREKITREVSPSQVYS